jgi:hypothetical protein
MFVASARLSVTAACVFVVVESLLFLLPSREYAVVGVEFGYVTAMAFISVGITRFGPNITIIVFYVGFLLGLAAFFFLKIHTYTSRSCTGCMSDHVILSMPFFGPSVLKPRAQFSFSLLNPLCPPASISLLKVALTAAHTIQVIRILIRPKDRVSTNSEDEADIANEVHDAQSSFPFLDSRFTCVSFLLIPSG